MVTLRSAVTAHANGIHSLLDGLDGLTKDELVDRFVAMRDEWVHQESIGTPEEHRLDRFRGDRIVDIEAIEDDEDQASMDIDDAIGSDDELDSDDETDSDNEMVVEEEPGNEEEVDNNEELAIDEEVDSHEEPDLDDEVDNDEELDLAEEVNNGEEMVGRLPTQSLDVPGGINWNRSFEEVENYLLGRDYHPQRYAEPQGYVQQPMPIPSVSVPDHLEEDGNVDSGFLQQVQDENDEPTWVPSASLPKQQTFEELFDDIMNIEQDKETEPEHDEYSAFVASMADSEPKAPIEEQLNTESGIVRMVRSYLTAVVERANSQVIQLDAIQGLTSTDEHLLNGVQNTLTRSYYFAALVHTVTNLARSLADQQMDEDRRSQLLADYTNARYTLAMCIDSSVDWDGLFAFSIVLDIVNDLFPM
ncbi:hypothetical protein P280DRAFT_513125 [Massarina eburnea CBS 473.64]|uniref:Uncharacterized protein n=1 Tax=Massarina eburnea CBS 473.64 TaxID=1395130 RepID=A0A6A6SCB5_9PLEO|nr:hypothetical protein P280DRAFT_513125 [Massarina eburnea CBS 473.64]